MKHYLEEFSLFKKIMGRKWGRIVTIIGVLSLVVEVIFDYLDLENAMRVSEFVCVGVFFAFGLGLLCVLPDGVSPYTQRKWYMLAIIWVTTGVVILLFHLYNLIHYFMSILYRI
jgi:hypothetical protein